MTREERLSALAERIEQISREPEQVRSRLASVLRPVLILFGWEPNFKVEALEALLSALKNEFQPGKNKRRDTQSDKNTREALDELSERTLSELEDNIEGAERSCVVKGYVPTARAAWLRRVYELSARAIWAAAHPSENLKNRFVFAIDSVVLLPPLARAAETGEKQGEAPRAASEIAPDDERMLEIHLAAVDHLLDSARGESEVLGRKRELLEGARRLLLDAAAAFSLEQKGVEARRAYIAEQIVHLNRLAAAGLSPSIALTHQAKTALSRGDRRLLMLALSEMDRIALQNADGVKAAHTYKALRRLKKSSRLRGSADRQGEIEFSASEIFGEGLIQNIRAGYEEARRDLGDLLKKPEAKNAEQAEHIRLLQHYWVPSSEEATMAAALSVDGCFDVGGSLSPVRALEVEERIRLVSYPTQELVLVPARDIEDVANALIDDPRRIFLSLAEGRLLARKYLQRESVARPKTKLVGEVRIYLLDGSDSMLEGGEGFCAGARARVRDAILLAELSTLQKRYSAHGRKVRVSLYYRYFTKLLWPLVKVDSIDSASKSMIEVLRTPRRGGTDIEGALLSSFELLRKAKEEDPDLARAQIVLVTDGNAIVRENILEAELLRENVVPLSVSVIALGEENPSLRTLVARQRRRGKRAFYHFIGDSALSSITEGKAVRGASFFLEEKRVSDSKKPREELLRELSLEVGELVGELSSLSEKRHALAIEMAELGFSANAEALREMGLSADILASEGQKAMREAMARDRLSLEKRFSNWFPIAKDVKGPSPLGLPGPGTPERADFDSVMIALTTIADVVSEFGGGALARQADAIELLERLLPDARLSPARYMAVLKNYSFELEPAILALHQAAGLKVQRSQSSARP